MSRSTLAQLAVFVLVAVVSLSYVGTRVLGGDPLAGSYRVTVRMADTGGLVVASEVTYRGVPVGKVESVTLEPDATGARMVLELDDTHRIPATAHAAVVMDSAIPIQHLDLQPTGDAGPYLADGSEIAADATSVPLPLETVLVNFMRLADSLDTDDLVTVAEELAAGLDGMAPELQAVVDNGIVLLDALRANQPRLTELLANGRKLVSDNSATVAALPELAATVRELTDQVRAATPDLVRLIDTGPPLAETMLPLLAGSQQSIAVLLGNLASTSQVMVTRTPALDELLVALPRGIAALGSIEHGGVADFDLVATQGPVCYYPNTRRPPTDTAPRDPVLDYHCPADSPTLQQRGAANAPRPGAPAAPQVTAYDPATRTTTGPDGQPFTIGANGGQDAVLGPRSWYALLLQGAS